MKNRWIFGKEIFKRIRAFKAAIDTLEHEEHRALFRSVLAAVLIPVSNVVISGKGRRYRGERARRMDNVEDVHRLFRAAFERVFSDICAYGTKSAEAFTVRCGDSRNAIAKVAETDLVFTSPPYPNSFDYSDVYNVELWALGYLTKSYSRLSRV